MCIENRILDCFNLVRDLESAIEEDWASAADELSLIHIYRKGFRGNIPYQQDNDPTGNYGISVERPIISH